MNAFWAGFEKQASSRMAKELAKHLGGTPKSLTREIHPIYRPSLRRLSATDRSLLKIDGYGGEYFNNIRDIRNKFRPAEAPLSVPERFAVLKKIREKTLIDTIIKERETKALEAKNRFLDALK